MNNKRDLIFGFLILVSTSCTKDSLTKKILGTWTGINEIKKTTLTNPVTNEIKILTDTLYSAGSGSYFYLNISFDTLTTVGNFNNIIENLQGLKYTWDGTELNFILNPYTTAGILNNNPVNTKSTVQILTDNHLTLYDVDSLGGVKNEVWFNFYK